MEEWVVLNEVVLQTVGTEEGVVVVFRVMVKGEFGVREPGEFKSVKLVDERAGLNAPLLWPVVFLTGHDKPVYVGERNDPPLRVPLQSKS